MHNYDAGKHTIYTYTEDQICSSYNILIIFMTNFEHNIMHEGEREREREREREKKEEKKKRLVSGWSCLALSTSKNFSEVLLN